MENFVIIVLLGLIGLSTGLTVTIWLSRPKIRHSEFDWFRD